MEKANVQNTDMVYYTQEYVASSAFYQMPKFLFTLTGKGIDSDCKVLYTIIKDRFELRLKNGWCDEQGYVYSISTKYCRNSRNA